MPYMDGARNLNTLASTLYTKPHEQYEPLHATAFKGDTCYSSNDGPGCFPLVRLVSRTEKCLS